VSVSIVSVTRPTSGIGTDDCAGHKHDSQQANLPAALMFMNHYLSEFAAERNTALNADGLEKSMKEKFPNLGLAGLPRLAAKSSFAN
jgi:hypothetical protein